MHGIQGAGVLLLSAVAGYWVLERAEGHKGQLRRVGRLLGWLVMLVSLAAFACKVFSCGTYDGGMGGTLCPFSRQPAVARPAK